jgi:hypothetical protein
VSVARFTVLLLCAALAGCGATERDTDASAVSDRFLAALQRGDGAAACAELGAATAAKLVQDEKSSCEEAILALDLPRGDRADHASVWATSAYVELKPSGAMFLDEGPDGWKIAAAGCRPSGSDREPYDCELEG